MVSMSFTQLLVTEKTNTQSTMVFGSEPAETLYGSRNNVDVDFKAPNYDWIFLCSPGAIRRIVMNLVGNSFKYTSSGSISIQLDLDDPSPSAEEQKPLDEKDSMLVVKVIDTGRGMSEEFMKTRLFV